MIPAKFPKTGPDGSFCVLVSLRCTTTDVELLAQHIDAWLRQWVIDNRYWKPSFTGMKEDSFEVFAGVPRSSKSKEGLLVIRLEGCPTGDKWWKDWYAIRLLPELRKAFVEIEGVEGVTNCP